MRVLRLGWLQFATRWSSNKDSKVGTVAHLRTLLVDEILCEEKAERRLNRLPTEAALPHQTQRDLGQLGTVDADADEVEKKAVFSAEELEVKSEAAVQRRLAAGISDPVQGAQPELPAFDQGLVGKWLEVLWKYTNKDTGEPVLIWSRGRVVRVADGLTDKRSKRAQKILPGGAVLWAWDADPEFGESAGEQWLILLPKKWNKQQHYSWRYDPCELGGPATAPHRAPRPQNVRRAAE